MRGGSLPASVSNNSPTFGLLGSGTVVTTTITYYYINGQRVAQAKDGVFTWIHADHLSSATRITDANGLEIRRLAYTSFGEEAENQGSGDDPKYTYTGKEADSTGLYYYGARYYDPALSRFITAGTVYDRGPQGLNRYSYALNNPIIYRDPTGHQASFFQGLQDAPPLFKRAVGKNIRAETQAVAKGAVEGVKVGAIVYISIVVPGAGEALDIAVLCDKNSSTTAKIAAGVSLGFSVLTFGLGPNYGAIDDTVEAGTKVSTLGDTIHAGAIDDTVHAGAVDEGNPINVSKTSKKTVKAYRAQGRPLISVDEAGNVKIARPRGRQRKGVVVHVGFDESRGHMWIEQKGRKQLVEFEVGENFLEKLRRTAQPEHGIVRDRTKPWRVDVDYPDQYAIPPSMLDEFEDAIVPGSGRVINQTGE